MVEKRSLLPWPFLNASKKIFVHFVCNNLFNPNTKLGNFIHKLFAIN